MAAEYPTVAGDNWELVKNWCFVAAQAKGDGDSHVALKILPAISADKSFLEWCKRRIDGTMGLRVREIGGLQGTGGGGQANLVTTTANVVRDMGTQMVAGFWQAMNASSQLGGGGDGGATSGAGGFGKKYSRSHIAQLKGFCKSEDVTKIPSVWYTFSTCRDLDLYRSALERRMERFSTDKGVEIDLGMYLEDESLKAIAQLQFNPAGGGQGWHWHNRQIKGCLFCCADHGLWRRSNGCVMTNKPSPRQARRSRWSKRRS